MDWYREINARLEAAQAHTSEARRRVYDALRAETPAAEHDRLEVAIRRIEQHALLDAPPAPAPAPIAPTDAVSDHVYDVIEFASGGGGPVRRGVAGWSDGPLCHVTLQVWDGPQGEGRAPDLGQALAQARKRLARMGYTPLSLPPVLAEAEARPSQRPGFWRRLRSVFGPGFS